MNGTRMIVWDLSASIWPQVDQWSRSCMQIYRGTSVGHAVQPGDVPGVLQPVRIRDGGACNQVTGSGGWIALGRLAAAAQGGALTRVHAESSS